MALDDLCQPTMAANHGSHKRPKRPKLADTDLSVVHVDTPSPGRERAAAVAQRAARVSNALIT